MWRTGLIALLLVILTGCDQVSVKAKENIPGAGVVGGETEAPVSDGSEDGDQPDGGSVVVGSDDLTVALEDARGFDAAPIADRVEVFIQDVAEVLPDASDPNLSGTWVWAWSRYGDVAAVAATESAEDVVRFEDFGFEVVNIIDNLGGVLELEFCYDRRELTLGYDGNGNLLEQQGGQIIGSIVNSQRLDIGEVDLSTASVEGIEAVVDSGSSREYFFKLASAPDSIIGTLTNTEPGGEPRIIELSCITYSEQADVTANVQVSFDNFYMYRSPGCCVAQGGAAELNNSFIRQEEHVVTVELNDPRFNGPVIQVLEFNDGF